MVDCHADSLDRLLEVGYAEAGSFSEMVSCGERFCGVLEEHPDESISCFAEDQADTCEDREVTRQGGFLDAGIDDEEDVFQEDLISCYFQQVSRFALLSAKRETELARDVKEGQDALVGLIWDARAKDRNLDELRRQLGKWQEKSARFPGLREKMVEHTLEALEKTATREDVSEEYLQLLSEARALDARIDAARNELIEGNLRLVLSIAKRYRGRGMSFLDLIQEGNMGLLKAVGRYDYTRGNRFSTYATWWVRQSIIRAIYDKTRTIRLPVHFIEMKNLFFKIFHELVRELGREPTTAEIAERSGLTLDKVRLILQLSSHPLSLEAPVKTEDQKLGDLIADDTAVSPLEDVSRQELVHLTHEVLSSLSAREETILKARFGIDGRREETLKNIGKRFNVSKERVRQIEKKAIRKLHHSLRRDQLECFLE